MSPSMTSAGPDISANAVGVKAKIAMAATTPTLFPFRRADILDHLGTHYAKRESRMKRREPRSQNTVK